VHRIAHLQRRPARGVSSSSPHVMTTASHLPPDLKWEAARLAMHGAFKWDGYYPMVAGPQEVLSFLEHHFDLQAKGENQDEAIQYAHPRARLRFQPHVPRGPGPIRSDGPPIFRRHPFSFPPDKPHELKKAALCFLSHIEARWFPVFSEHVPPDAVQDFCEDLVSAINEVFVDEARSQEGCDHDSCSPWRTHQLSDFTFPFTCGNIWNSFTN
jgi:hypothetical protein